MKYKMLNVGAAAVLSAFLAVPAFANEANKIGYVNTQRVFRDAPAAVKAQKKLDAEFSRRDQDLQVVAKKLQTLQESLEKNGVTMSESERRNKERELNDLNRDFQRRQREFREDLNLRQNEEMAAVLEKANKAIKQIAENEKFDLILQDVVWVSPKLDITDKVIKALSDDKAGK
ncbi:OmpH family outer membrane protein [Azospira sp. APE16]|uniref:Outer membrane protein n=1 Tax=Azospira oryzae (strain ATCC BAA-33 / DSM 13638 / PS) TaxID=640081 RepID=G8QPD4_AZOOP|nr:MULTISPECIES: OmpH family outer membrane protein [Azospira]AEV27035.1 outer membrane protein [Azospira oryzae PS]BBN87602.1 outer membrane protein chaperone [Azospira sp. I09]